MFYYIIYNKICLRLDEDHHQEKDQRLREFKNALEANKLENDLVLDLRIEIK